MCQVPPATYTRWGSNTCPLHLLPGVLRCDLRVIIGYIMIRMARLTVLCLYSGIIVIFTGTTYIRWGSSTCPSTSNQVYTGVIGGANYAHSGGATNSLCLPMNPEYDLNAHQGNSRLLQTFKGNSTPIFTSVTLYLRLYETDFHNCDFFFHNFDFQTRRLPINAFRLDPITYSPL